MGIVFRFDQQLGFFLIFKDSYKKKFQDPKTNIRRGDKFICRALFIINNAFPDLLFVRLTCVRDLGTRILGVLEDCEEAADEETLDEQETYRVGHTRRAIHFDFKNPDVARREARGRLNLTETEFASLTMLLLAFLCGLTILVMLSLDGFSDVYRYVSKYFCVTLIFHTIMYDIRNYA